MQIRVQENPDDFGVWVSGIKNKSVLQREIND
jgi:hypothetical protein